MYLRGFSFCILRIDVGVIYIVDLFVYGIWVGV